MNELIELADYISYLKSNCNNTLINATLDIVLNKVNKMQEDLINEMVKENENNG